MGKWDSTSKRLLREKPQHYTSWLIDGALFIKALQTELKSRNIYADGLFAILVREKQALLHIEFQRYKDPLMLERLLEYNVLAASENDWIPVYTFVIYLRKDGEV